MGRYIDIDKIEDWAMLNFGVVVPEFYDIIDAYEDLRADVEPVVHAHWTGMVTKYDEVYYVCSHCEKWARLRNDYCSCCGAKMDEVQDG